MKTIKDTIRSRVLIMAACMFMHAFTAIAKGTEYDLRCDQVKKDNKELLKSLEKTYDLKSITPVLNTNDNYALLGYIGQKKASKGTMISTPYGESMPNNENMLQGFFSPAGKLVVPVEYAYVVPISIDNEPLLRLCIYTPYEEAKAGIFDLDNNVVIPIQYKYIDAFENHGEYRDSYNGIWYDVPKCDAYFKAVSLNEDTIYYFTPRGKLKTKVGPGRRSIPGYTFVSETINDIFTNEAEKRKHWNDVNHMSPILEDGKMKYFGGVSVGKAARHPSDMGLIGPDGSTILDNKYRNIKIYGIDSQNGELLPVCVYNGESEDLPTYGAINLLTGEEVLPYAFYRAGYNNLVGKWVVKRHRRFYLQVQN